MYLCIGFGWLSWLPCVCRSWKPCAEPCGCHRDGCAWQRPTRTRVSVSAFQRFSVSACWVFGVPSVGSHGQHGWDTPPITGTPGGGCLFAVHRLPRDLARPLVPWGHALRARANEPHTDGGSARSRVLLRVLLRVWVRVCGRQAGADRVCRLGCGSARHAYKARVELRGQLFAR